MPTAETTHIHGELTAVVSFPSGRGPVVTTTDDWTRSPTFDVKVSHITVHLGFRPDGGVGEPHCSFTTNRILKSGHEGGPLFLRGYSARGKCCAAALANDIDPVVERLRAIAEATLAASR